MSKVHVQYSELFQVIISIYRHGVNPNQPRGSDGQIPTFIAAAHGHMECLQVLIQHGGDFSARMSSTSEGYKFNAFLE